MLKGRRFFSIALIAVMLGLLLAACTQPAAPTTAPEPTATAEMMAADWYDPADLENPWINVCTDTPPRYGGTIVSSEQDLAMTGQSWIIRASTNDEFLFSQLVDLAMNAADMVPDVATSWDISDDGLVYTYHLRNDVLWHDGEPLTAEDVKYTIEMFYHPDTGAGTRTTLPLFAIAGTDEFAAGEADEITGVQVLDDFTVQITLKEARADFFYGMAGMNLFPKHIYGEIPFIELADSPYAREQVIGSGPFKIGEFEPDQYYILEAFEEYYQGRPYLDRIIVRIGLTETASQIAALEAGELNLGGLVNGPDRDRVERDPNLTVVGGPLPGAMAIWPNHDRITDKRILQALVYAVDREAVATGIYGEGQALAYDYLTADPSPALDWLSPDTPTYPYDPDMARQLLDEAGWDPDRTLEFVTYYSTDLDRRVVAAMQQYWADVGVKVKVEHMDGPTFVTRFYQEASFDLGYGCCGVASPFEYPRYACGNTFPTGYNGSRYCNEEVDEMVQASMTEPDLATRTEMWYEISEITNDELLHMPMFQQDRRYAISKNVCNYQFRQYTNIAWPETNPQTWYLAE